MWTKLSNVLRQRRVLAALGLALVSLLVWFAGDAIALYDHRPLASATARLGFILALLACALAWEGWRAWRAWQANRRLLGALGTDDGTNAALSQREVVELNKRFTDALATLRQCRFEDKAGNARSYLYQLPWYMFIGAPGSGKTTALLNSGLRFPLAGKLGSDAIKGIGGTRNCDWWFTDEAVLLDTAGRYTTQTSNQEVDAAAWKGFLTLLKKYRPQQPLNGAIVTLSVADLFTGSAVQRAAYARAVRERIQELHQALGVRLPIYVMVTKCDLLAGFAEFFADLSRETRSQVWGVTFPLHLRDAAASAAAASFDAELDTLRRRLEERLLARMQQERDPQRRARIFAFPRQFAGFGPGVKEFLDEVFLPSSYAEAPLLRGVYFTSGTQEGTPFDRVLGQLSRQWGLAAQALPSAAGSGRSFFLTRLLREVVFAESDVSGRTAMIERRRNRIAVAVHAGLGVLALLLATGWTISFVRNKALVAQADQAVGTLRQQAAAVPALPRGDVRVTLPLLYALRALPAGGEADVPLTLGLGLYQGGKLGSQARWAYADALQAAFLPRVALRLEQQIGEAETPEARYETLKAYLMLYDPRHLNATELEAWVVRDWERTLPRDLAPEVRQDLTAHLRDALSQGGYQLALPMDMALVEQTRRELAAAPLAERAYSRLKRLGADGVADFRLSDAAGPSAALLFSRASGRPLTEGVAGLFTRKGYEQGLKLQASGLVARLAQEESWVLGPLADPKAATKSPQALADMQRLYFAEYVRVWDELLADLRLNPTATLVQSIQAMTLLSAADSPLKRLLQTVAEQTRLAPDSRAAAPEKAPGGAIDKVASAVRSTVDKLLGGSSSAGEAQERPEAQVDRHFEQLHRVVEGAAGAPAPLDAMLAVLKEYEVHLRATEEAIKRGTTPPSDAAILARMRSEADRMPAPLGQLVTGMVGRSTSQAAMGAQAGLQKAVAGEVGVYCRQAVEGRYPFVHSQAKEVPLGDFSRLFGPGGTIDVFVKTRLSGAVDVSGPVWRPMKLAEGVDGLDAQNILQFQRASVIRDAFFAGGNPSPAFSADLLLLKADEGLAEVQLTVDGQITRLRPGMPGGTRLSWPSLNAGSPVRLSATTAAGTETPALRFDGQWALFRLLDAARPEGGTPDRMALSFALGEHRVVFELRSYSVRNPLRLSELAQFRCPG